MSLFPGDIIECENGRKFTLGPLVAYQGKDDCMDVRCRRRSLKEPGCMDYHCPTCDEPCSMMGHKCPQRGEA